MQTAEIVYKVSEKEMAEVFKKLSLDVICDKFYNSVIPASMAAKLHCVSVNTIRKYTDMGMLIPEKTSPLEFRASEVLKWEMDKLKYSKHVRSM